ncbi:MAG: FAD-dependent oxidoreductase [Rhodospirillaceae bacterium]
MTEPTGDSAFSKRQFLKASATTLAMASLPHKARQALAEDGWDVIVIGAGSAGLPAAIFAAERGAKVLIIEGSHRIGGTLDRSSGQMSAAGTSLQRAKGIKDTPQDHFDDVMRISRNTANPEMVRLAVDNAAETIEWLISIGWSALPEHPVKGLGHEDYLIARYQWGPEGAMTVYRALEPIVLDLVRDKRVTILTQTQGVELLTDNNNAVTGVVAEGPDGQRLTYASRNVLITTGGAGGDSAMFEELNGVPLYIRWAYPYNRGGGVKLAQSVGGYTRGQEHYLCNDGGVLTDTNYPSPQLASAVTSSEERKPWEIFVNELGERYTKEGDPSVDNREHALRRQPNQRYWAIFDDAILDQAPPFLRGWTNEEIRRGFGKHHMFYTANTLAELAKWSGVNEIGLTKTVERYNEGQAIGRDADFGREHMPLPISKPPYYAIQLQGYSILVFGGIAVDTNFRVIREDGSPIENLYAAGEVLGKAAYTGSAYVGGMSLTPALTAGRLLGQKILKLEA